MFEKEVLVFNGKVEISKPELVHLLDNYKFPPIPAGIYFDWGHSKYGGWDGNGKFPFQVGFDEEGLRIFTFWNGETQITYGETHQYGLVEFNAGSVELKESKDGSEHFIDVTIISSWSPLRSYYEAIADVLKLFEKKTKPKKISKRGRRTPTDEVKLNALKKWDEIDKSFISLTLEQFLKQEFGENSDGSPVVAVPTFHGWRLQLRGKGIEI